MARPRPRSTQIRCLLAATLVMIVAACGDDQLGEADPGASSTVPESTVPDSTVPDSTAPESTVPDSTVPDSTVPDSTVPDSTVPEWPEVVGEAVAALAADTGSDPAAVDVVAYERVTWRNGALGCPEPGRSYTQALVPGYRIELVLDGATIWYHGSSDGAPFRCDTPEEPAEGGATGGVDT